MAHKEQPVKQEDIASMYEAFLSGTTTQIASVLINTNCLTFYII